MTDVVIVGGGPNGLMLASELCLTGVRPIVLEKLPERRGPIRASGLIGRVVQVFDHRGLFGRIAEGTDKPVPVPFFNFAGIPMDLRGLEGNPVHILPIPQPQLEEFLERHAGELGADIRRQHEVLDLSQDADGVTVQVRSPEGDYELRASYLVGCDGASSTVRKLIGIGFPDTGEQDIVSRAADVVLPESMVGGTTGPTGFQHQASHLEVPGVGRVPFGYTRTANGVIIIGAFLPGMHILGTIEWGRSDVDLDAPMTIDELRESARRVVGADIPMSVPTVPGSHRMFRVAGNSRQAERYREGRVLLAGDAAHVHATVNGPGLNLGLQDAVNLGWKLAACVQGWAPEGLLDTYESERRPVGERVLLQTQAQTALFAPGAETTSLRTVFGELLRHEDSLRHIAELMTGADIRYDMSPAGDTDHPLVGGWAPDMPLTTLTGQTRLAELMRSARPVLLDLTGGPALAEAAAGWKDRVDVVAADADADTQPAPAMLIRPDGYVAWAAGTAGGGEEDPTAGLCEALTAWFGAPQ